MRFAAAPGAAPRGTTHQCAQLAPPAAAHCAALQQVLTCQVVGDLGGTRRKEGASAASVRMRRRQSSGRWGLGAARRFARLAHRQGPRSGRPWALLLTAPRYCRAKVLALRGTGCRGRGATACAPQCMRRIAHPLAQRAPHATAPAPRLLPAAPSRQLPVAPAPARAAPPSPQTGGVIRSQGPFAATPGPSSLWRSC